MGCGLHLERGSNSILPLFPGPGELRSTLALKEPEAGICPDRLRGEPMSDQDRSFQARLSAFADGERKRAKMLPPGQDRDLALQKIRQAEAASNLDEWANSPRSQPQKSVLIRE